MSTAATDISSPTPIQVIRPKTGWPALELGEAWRFRDLLLIFGGRDLKLRYKQTILGVLWVIIQPLLAGGVLAFVFGGVAGMEGPAVQRADGTIQRVPMFLIAFIGTIGWNLFARSAIGGTQSMIGSAHLVSKVWFPRLIIPAAPLVSILVDLMIILPLAIVMVGVFWAWPTLNLVMLPAAMLVLMVMGVGVGLIAAAGAVHFRDVKHIMPLAIQMLMLISPVGYALATAMDKVGDFGWAYQYLNPLAPAVAMFRWSLLGADGPPWSTFLVAGVISLAVLYVGLLLFKWMERSFADVI